MKQEFTESFNQIVIKKKNNSKYQLVSCWHAYWLLILIKHIMHDHIYIPNPTQYINLTTTLLTIYRL